MTAFVFKLVPGFKKKNITIEEDESGVLHVRYFNTRIVSWNKKLAFVRLDTGGYKNISTRRAMNQALRQIESSAIIKTGWKVQWHGEEIPFEDGMELCL